MMQVIKMDGRIVDYEKSKIETTIERANNEVREQEKASKEEISKQEKASKEEISNIVNYIGDLDRNRILVEDIQEIIEQKLMEIGKYNLAKRYIVYKYTKD